MFRLYTHLSKFSRHFSTYIRAGERQKHGFIYQNKVINKYRLLEEKGYTAEYDATYKEVPVQIKCFKHGSSLELGDYTRNKNKRKDFILAIGWWKNVLDTKLIANEHLLYIEHYKYTQHLGYYTDYIETLMYEEFKEISNHQNDDITWKQFCKKYKTYWKQDNKISVRFKRDHKKQKRIQCAISWGNIDNWLLKDFQQISLDVCPGFEHASHLIL